MTKKADKTSQQAIQKSDAPRAATPFEAMDRLMDQMFASHFPGGWMRPFRHEWPEWATTPAPFEGKAPKVDIIEREKEVVVKAELPGVDKNDIEVSVANNTVTIKATTSHEDKEEKGDYYRSEMSRGSFARTLMLPAEVDEANTKGSFKNGVLEITLPRTQTRDETSHKVKIS